MNNLAISGLPRPKNISPGDVILYEEDVFKFNDKKPVFSGKRTAQVRVIKPGVAGVFLVEIIKCKGVNAFPEGVNIQKPIVNLLRGFLINDSSLETQFKSGGYLQGKDASGKVVQLDNADRGGMSVGATHKEGGIKGVVDGNRGIEFENKEPLIVPQASSDPTVDTFEGKQMTAKQVLSAINVDNGGKSFEEGGDVGTESKPIKVPGRTVILTAPVSSNEKKYDYNGKKMTGLEIASAINVRNNGVAFKEGGEIECSVCQH